MSDFRGVAQGLYEGPPKVMQEAPNSIENAPNMPTDDEEWLDEAREKLASRFNFKQ